MKQVIATRMIEGDDDIDDVIVNLTFEETCITLHYNETTLVFDAKELINAIVNAILEEADEQ
jgi:hypothetical protein